MGPCGRPELEGGKGGGRGPKVNNPFGAHDGDMISNHNKACVYIYKYISRYIYIYMYVLTLSAILLLRLVFVVHETRTIYSVRFLPFSIM